MLCRKAEEALENAYCPYSKYRVGAAVMTGSGKVYTGCNIENSSYGASNCGERTAVFNAVSSGERNLTAIAVFTDIGNPPPFPCGICRQVLSEFCGGDTPVIVFDGEKSVYNLTLEELLPYSFELKSES
ncbi:MAG TPA: cytidine deaminase [Ruminococcaceae bacterium]|nr:cytidine deaminase [Oscillospiraceae bacterium]